LNVVPFAPEEDVMTEVDAAYKLVIVAAGKINDTATVVINNDNINFFLKNLLRPSKFNVTYISFSTVFF
jgi:hypothetical protein